MGSIVLLFSSRNPTEKTSRSSTPMRPSFLRSPSTANRTNSSIRPLTASLLEISSRLFAFSYNDNSLPKLSFYKLTADYLHKQIYVLALLDSIRSVCRAPKSFPIVNLYYLGSDNMHSK